ncbi:MAG: hypothetical protein BECKG1743D_GA0114223_110292 [Candidatus Kentron sp. G]|nr:MAG: hypothetical protein BECKG1743E_GA0114224_110742 [Candidatus Kentron sp. G]VFN07295.1 MAG: hypothetical protein BECKG1743D_GA0114223_110292 [Candidatus Kentron sp. G]
MTIQCQYHWLLSLRGGRVTPILDDPEYKIGFFGKDHQDIIDRIDRKIAGKADDVDREITEQADYGEIIGLLTAFSVATHVGGR